jgi:hypothetical protein
MIIYIDIDNTICTTSRTDYNGSIPIQERISKINKLYDEGHNIIYWTARGSGTGMDWEETTKRQFGEWGVKYHELRFGKPVYDLFIDDKNIDSETFFNE